ncbi:NAD(P)-dependent alcohol dehydrogenase [Paraburkholderia largidicola]|uniref:Dehydrogenase n=1 Tax=Paraburkholderia largidicola TaxID=3014751 RepID=A0A7I8C1U7_9BURK|nr:NAD(P)-dependent alcohol dehydrogenase [Paraburkholderia sp. PGU16]BCF95056.1 dehydrogenase [Paraburkholderia sp. PGU16]
MTEMRAVQYDAYGPPEVLRVGRVPVPKMKLGHVLVKVAASSVNAADVLVRSGKLRLLSGSAFPRGVGFDFAGSVVEVDASEQRLYAGDQVWGFLNGLKQIPSGAAAEYVLAPASAVACRPSTIDAVSAAALSGAAGAALGVLTKGVDLQQGERVLVRGAGGGVGTAAVQIARAMGGRVTALIGANHVSAIRDLGAEAAYDYRTTDPRSLGKFDVILDPVAQNIRDYRRLLAPDGRMVVMTLGGVGEAAYWLASAVFGKQRVRFVQSPPDHDLLAALTPLVDKRMVVPVVAGVHSMENASTAHLALKSRGVFGKHVIQVTSHQ